MIDTLLKDLDEKIERRTVLFVCIKDAITSGHYTTVSKKRHWFPNSEKHYTKLMKEFCEVIVEIETIKVAIQNLVNNE